MKQTGPTSHDNDLWENAEKLFEGNDIPWVKKNRDKTTVTILRSGKYRFAIGDLIGFGLTSKVKELVERSGMKAVAKYTGGTATEVTLINKATGMIATDETLSLHEEECLKRLGLLLGRVEIPLDKPKKLINREKHPNECAMLSYELLSAKRVILIMPKHDGRLLVDILNELPQDLSTLSEDEFVKWDKIALGCAKALFEVHQKRVIHGDIKTDQFIVNMVGDSPIVKLIDYGCSIPLKEHESIRFKKEMPDSVYTAPEAALGVYSFASDIFALGRVFEEFPGDEALQNLTADMCQRAPYDRMKMTEVIAALQSRLLKIDDPEVDVLASEFYRKNSLK